ncbi:MAG: hypothetical protein HFI51_00930 [Lachnospiraceae bacterium]|nr:hypothetical protein [Lachnospiraceae bacterium]
MMETTEEIELPDISPDLEDSGESEEAVPDITGDETAEPEDTDGAHSGEDETEPEDSGEDTETDNDAADTEMAGDDMETDETRDTETDETGDAETETGDGQTEDETETDETETPTESLNVNGSILILPEDYEFDPETFGLSGEAETDTAEAISPEQFTQLSEQLELLEESVSVQTDVLYGGTAVISLVLGAVLGVLLLHGFRLRRV